MFGANTISSKKIKDRWLKECNVSIHVLVMGWFREWSLGGGTSFGVIDVGIMLMMPHEITQKKEFKRSKAT